MIPWSSKFRVFPLLYRYKFGQNVQRQSTFFNAKIPNNLVRTWEAEPADIPADRGLISTNAIDHFIYTGPESACIL